MKPIENMRSDGLSLLIPMSDVFDVIQRQRRNIVNWVRRTTRSGDRDKLDALLSQVAGVALRRGRLSYRNWETSNVSVLECVDEVESEHPYRSRTNLGIPVRFPGAPHITITFDERTCTERNADYVTIYKDETRTEYWGPKERLSGDQDCEWPGVKGRPSLVIPSDHCYIVFKSDEASQDWGFRVMLRAPVAPTTAEELSTNTRSDGSEYPLRWCQKALAASKNDASVAMAYLLEHEELLAAQDEEEAAQRQQAESLCEQVGSAYSLFRDPTGSVDVNLQTAEVFLCVRVLRCAPQCHCRSFPASVCVCMCVFGVRACARVCMCACTCGPAGTAV